MQSKQTIWGERALKILLKTGDQAILGELRNEAGLRVALLPNGGLHSMFAGEVMINQVLSSPLEGGLFRLYLRRHGPDGVDGVPIAGLAPGLRFRLDHEQAVWRGAWGSLRWVCRLRLHPRRPAWCWNIAVRQEGDGPADIDLLYGQDLGLAEPGAVRNNEAFISQYIDHTILRHPEWGPVVCSRQNLAQGAGQTNPWLVQGGWPGVEGFCTDGYQFFGVAHRETGRPAALTQPALPSRRRQYEMAYVGLLSRRWSLRSGQTATASFFACFEAHHPAATTDADLNGLIDLDRDFTGSADIETAAPEEEGLTIRPTLFQPPSLFQSLPLTTAEVDRLFPGPRRHEERAGNELLSFFYGRDRHVVLPAKERQVERPHGHILRSGRSALPERDAMCTTCFAAGVFNAQVTVGNTNFNKFLSVIRNPLNALRTGGQRIFVGAAGGWNLLGLPSAFEMGAGFCRWIYKDGAGMIIVRVAASPDDPAVVLDARVAGGPRRSLLISHELVLGNQEGDTAGTVSLDPDRGRIAGFPAPTEELSRRYPDAAFCIVTPDYRTVAEVAGDRLLSGEVGEQHHPYAVIRTGPVASFRLALIGHLQNRTELLRLADRYEEDWSMDALVADGDRYWASLLPLGAMRQPEASEIARLDDILKWYVHNAVIHGTAPHGLEQYSGAAWGVRDVCQGPVEYLCATGNPAAVPEMLKMVFSRQYVEDGTWPQWFMFHEYYACQSEHSHGDVIIWPLKALCDYLEATGDFAMLDLAVPYTRKTAGFVFTDAATPIFEHVEKLIGRLSGQCLPGTRLPCYGEGDWDDTLQPARPEWRERMASSWTVALWYQTLRRYQRVCARAGRPEAAGRLDRLAAELGDDFQRRLVIDGVVAGFYLHGDPPRGLLHPRDETTGIRYRLLPMTRAILGELFTPDQADRHLGLIREHLLHPDGVRLMDRPATYRGGIERHFKRADTAACFGREIGLQYVHAHLRYLEALAHAGRPDELARGLMAVVPIRLDASVPNARPRQSNAYFSSSDAGFADRYEASARFDELRRGEIPVHGGWRIYSSGPGLFIRLVLSRVLGWRECFDDVVLDPVLPAAWNGLEVETRWAGRAVRCRYFVRDRGYGPYNVVLNGSPLLDLRREENPYRAGGVLVRRAEWVSRLSRPANEVDIYL
jgi:cellobiose phosphorylase